MQVDFYVLPEGEALFPFVCRLIESHYEAKKTVYIHMQTEADAHTIDETLWTFKHNSFIPHHLVGEGPKIPAPVLVGYPELTLPRTDILINLAHDILAQRRYQHVIEIVTSDPAQKQRSRDHYLSYKRAGATLQTFQPEMT